MGQQLVNISELKSVLNKNVFKLILADPKLSDLALFRLMFVRIEDRTRVCYKMLGRSGVRGERLIKLSYSWFSAKFIQVKC